jgi:beta-lactamase class A
MRALHTQLASLERRAPGQLAIMVEDLTTGLRASVNAGATMPAASTIKIPVMIEVFRRIDHGDFQLQSELTLTAKDRDWGSGDLADAPLGGHYSVQRLVALMIDESDNTATNMLIRYVGRSNINATLRALGLQHTWLTDDIRSNGPIRTALRTSPADMVALLDGIARGSIVSPWACATMIAILAAQHHNGLIPASLPGGLTIAHKTGTLHDTLNDVGIVYLANAPYAIAIMTTNLPSLDDGERTIHAASQLTYHSIAQLASWRAANLPTLAASLLEPPQALESDLQWWTPVNRVFPSALSDERVGSTDLGTPHP